MFTTLLFDEGNIFSIGLWEERERRKDKERILLVAHLDSGKRRYKVNVTVPRDWN
jgi:hypothetical protein